MDYDIIDLDYEIIVDIIVDIIVNIIYDIKGTILTMISYFDNDIIVHIISMIS